MGIITRVERKVKSVVSTSSIMIPQVEKQAKDHSGHPSGGLTTDKFPLEIKMTQQKEV